MLTETLIVFNRQMRILLRNPTWLILGLAQPLLFLVMFGPLLTNVRGNGLPGGDLAWQVFIPGLLIQLTVFGAGFAGFTVLAEMKEGVIERQVVTPARRISLILGRTLSNLVQTTLQSVLLVGASIPFGLHIELAGVLITLVLIAVLAVGVSAASYAMALLLKHEDRFAPFIQSTSLPLLLLSGTFLPMSLAPGWLETLSRINPLTHIVDGARALFRGDYGDSSVWVCALIVVGLSVALAWFGGRVFARQSS